MPTAVASRAANQIDLSHHFSWAGLTVATKTIANFIEKASRLYEQERSAVLPVAALEMYVKRWLRWTTSGRIALLVQIDLRCRGM